ncbi:MAG: hypothetical protein M3R24_29965 [Chloroflexota bacterium]|nr:hypothetical protein [Chloroflexota bacterium]
MDPKIKEIVEIQSGYTSYVDLRHELFDDNRNVGRMARYRPITSHRTAFERMARSLNVKDKRCYLLTGPYGTGKSHLCMMFANYLQTPAGEKPMPEFFENYSDVDPNSAEALKAKRSSGHYLIALCHWGGHGDFEEIVLRAVDEALRREGFDADFDTHYLQAIKKIEEWETLDSSSGTRGNFFPEFESALQELSPPQTVGNFKKRLRVFDFTALDDFKRIHHNLTTAPFTYDKSDLISIITSTLASDKFKERFMGILVLFDEFGDTMERGNLSPKMFQQFAQLAAETPTGCAKLIFVGTAHKGLTDYAKAYSTQDFRTASDRVEEVPLTPDGVEDIIAAIVSPVKTSPLWQEKVATKSSVFDSFLPDCKRLDLFNWLTGPKMRKNIIENIFPMHPMATAALLQLAKDVASNNRSVFTFFSGDLGGDDTPGSYGDFVATTSIETNGKLNLYTADKLYDYFADTLSSDNRELRDTIREIIKDYENTRRELNRVASQDMDAKIALLDDPLIDRILRLMLIYEIIQVPNRLDNLQFGLYRTTQQERAELQNRLQALATRGVLYFAKDTNVYEFKKSKSVDLDRLIEEYKQEPKNHPTNIVVELNALVALDKNDRYFNANDYNLTYSEDKRLERRFVRPADLGSEMDTPQGKLTYFQQLEAELQRDARKSDYEGFALYAVCQTTEEIQKVKDYSAHNTSNRIIVAVPKLPVPMLDAVMELRALLHIEASPEAQNFTVQDHAVLNARLSGDSNRPGARGSLKTLRNKLMSPKDIVWYRSYASPLPVDENKPSDAANRVMEQLYSDYRNLFTHDDFNKLRNKLDSKNVALKEAVEELLDYTVPIVIDTGFAQQRGDIRYLQRCLLYNGVLRQIKTEVNKLRCEPETNPDKYEKKLASLAQMVRDVGMLQSDAKLHISNWLTKYRQPPYGQGPVALALSLAFIRRIFGDSIRIKADESAIGELPLRSFEEVSDLVDGRSPNAFLSYRPLRQEEKDLANVIFKIFGKIDTAADVVRGATLPEAHAAMKEWWEGLPPLARVAKLYSKETHPYAASFIDTMIKIASKDPHTFLFTDLPEVLGAEPGLVVTQDIVNLGVEQLPKIKQTFEHALEHVEARIMGEVRQIFGVEGHTYSDTAAKIADWYNSLDTNQRDPHANWHINDSKPLVTYLKTVTTNVVETFLDRIPASQDYNMKRVAEWMSDRVSEYTDRIRRGKQHIEANRIKVDPPSLVLKGIFTQENGQVSFKGNVLVQLTPKRKGDKIYVVEGNADPTSPATAREEVTSNGPFTVSEHKTIRYAVQDVDGNWSKVETLKLVNENKKFEISTPQQKGLLTKDESVSFVFPHDAQGFAVTCHSLFSLGLERQVLTLAELEQSVQAALEQLRKG